MKQIRLDGVVGFELLASDFDAQAESDEDIEIIVASPGGDIAEGLSIHNSIDRFPGKVNAIIDFGFSMASVFPMAADHIAMNKNSSLMMIHRPYGGSVGNADDHRDHADALDKMQEMITGIYVSRSGLSEGKIEDLLAAETWMNAQEALDNGFIDEVISGGKQDFEAVAMAAVSASGVVNFDSKMFASKINQLKNGKPSRKAVFKDVRSLKDVELVMRNEYQLSRADATAIVSAVKKAHGEHEGLDELQDLFNNFKLG